MALLKSFNSHSLSEYINWHKALNMEPILKWAGGKRRLISELEKLFPSFVIEKEPFNYYEPFFGGGAVLFESISKYNPKKIIINDINSRLTNFYAIAQRNPSELAATIEETLNKFHATQNKKRFFEEKRSLFNNTKNNIEQASLLYFLNKSCFNGIYRENKSGNFNVPYGQVNKINFDSNNFFEVSNFLQQRDVEISNDEFQKITEFESNSFFFLDPPYRPISKTSAFTAYSHKSTNNENLQISLAEYCKKIHENHSFFLQTNSFSEDGFFQELYKRFKIEEITVRRGIAAKSESRRKVSEIVIYNYENREISPSK